MAEAESPRPPERRVESDDGRPWLRCYRCWSQNLEAQVHYDAILRIDPELGTFTERVDEVQEAVVQCLDCMHDQPHLTFHDGRIEPVEDRWERMVTGTPWVASCTVMVDQDMVEVCSGPEATDSLTYGAFGEAGTREFFTHVRFHKHEEERIVVHLLVELYRRVHVAERDRDQAGRDAAAGELDRVGVGAGVAAGGLERVLDPLRLGRLDQQRGDLRAQGRSAADHGTRAEL